MYQENFGTNNPAQIHFNNEDEYYKALGYLAQNNNTTSLHWENNELQGAWGSEGRIHFYVLNPSIPGNFHLTAGTGNIHHRTNCNEFLSNLYNNYGFVNGKIQNMPSIRNNIPIEYLTAFDLGLALPH